MMEPIAYEATILVPMRSQPDAVVHARDYQFTIDNMDLDMAYAEMVKQGPDRSRLYIDMIALYSALQATGITIARRRLVAILEEKLP